MVFLHFLADDEQFLAVCELRLFLVDVPADCFIVILHGYALGVSFAMGFEFGGLVIFVDVFGRDVAEECF